MKDTYEMCRLCLAKDQVNVHIFEGKGNEEQLLLKISTCLPIQISRGDKFPKKICGVCSEKVNVMFLFWNTSVISELKLLEWSQQNCKIRKSAKAKSENFRKSDVKTDRNDQEVEDLLGRKGYNKRVSNCNVKTKNKRLKDREQSCSIVTIQDDDGSSATSKVNSPNVTLSSKEILHAVESIDIVEEKLGSGIADTQDLSHDLVEEEVCIEEVDAVKWNEVAEEEPDIQDLQQDVLIQEEVATEEVDNIVEIVEEEPATITTDTQDLQHDFKAQEEELGDTVEWNEVVEEESTNNAVDSHDLLAQEVDNAVELSKVVDEQAGNSTEDSKVVQHDHIAQEDVSIEELSDLTSLEVVSSNAVEEVRSSSTVGFQNDTQEDDLAQELLKFANEQAVHTLYEKLVEETVISTTDTQDLQVQEEVSVEEVSHLTTLEIISNDTGEEVRSSSLINTTYGFQEDSFIQELEVSHEETVPAVELSKPVKKKLWKVTAITRKVNVEERKLKPKNTTCIVPTCDGNKNNTRKVFHPLPADDEIRKLWLELISRPDLLKKPYHELQQERVCGAHFEPSQYYNKSKIKRHRCIVPNCDGRTKNVRQTWHALPNDKELREKWLTVLKRRDLLGIDSDLKHKKVCSAHFAPSQYRCPSSDFLNARTIPLPIEDERETMKPSTTNGAMLPPVTPSKRPISRQKRRLRDEREPVKLPTTNGTILPPVIPPKRPVSRQNRRRRDARKPMKLSTMNVAMLPPVTPSNRPSSRQKQRRLSEREPVKSPTKNDTMLPLVAFPNRPISRQKRRLRSEREPVKPLATNSTMLPLVINRPMSRQKRRLRGEREPVKPPIRNDTMQPIVILSRRPLSRQKRRLRGEREPVKPLTTDSTILTPVSPSKEPIGGQKRKYQDEKEPVKSPTTNTAMLPPVTPSRRPISQQKRRLRGEKEPLKPPIMLPPVTPSRQKRKCRELSSQSIPKVTKVYSPRKKRKIDEQ